MAMIKVVTFLIEAGANTNNQDKVWLTCVHYSCAPGALNVCVCACLVHSSLVGLF